MSKFGAALPAIEVYFLLHGYMRALRSLLLLAFQSYPPLGSLPSRELLSSCWYPVLPVSELRRGEVTPLTLSDTPFVAYEEADGQCCVVYGVCPHQGAAFRKGSVNRLNDCLVCPYHAFHFRRGQFIQIPGSLPAPSATRGVPRVPCTVYEDVLFINPSVDLNQGEAAPPLEFPIPEASDPSFTSVSGERKFTAPAEVVTENVLDMLHISYVHSFGNRELPLPFNVSFQKLAPGWGRSTFLYHSGVTSLGRWFGVDELKVENEYILPSTTVTRVTAGKIVKTVVTHCCPTGGGRSVLFWRVYRNFWGGSLVEKVLFDFVVRGLMELTLSEDQKILKDVVPSRFDLRTPYDKTILSYRSAKRKWK